MKDIMTAPFVEEMKKTTANMYRLGWDERNGGNISYLLDEKEVGEYLDLTKVIRTIPTGFNAPSLVGKIFIVTGTGKYFKNVEGDPETNLGIIRIAEDGTTAELALDSGSLLGQIKLLPFCEVELELKSGDPEACRALIESLAAARGLRVQPLSKYARAKRLP